MDKIILIMVTILIIAIILVVSALYVIQNRKKNKYKEEIDKLEIEKNKLDSSPIIPELSKIESYLNNES